MKLYTGTIDGLKYVLTIKPAPERATRNNDGGLKLHAMHLAILTLVDGDDVCDMYEREYHAAFEMADIRASMRNLVSRGEL